MRSPKAGRTKSSERGALPYLVHRVAIIIIYYIILIASFFEGSELFFFVEL